MRYFSWATAVAVAAAAVVLVFATSGGGAALAHGIGGAKNCQTETKVADDMFCFYTIRNNSDDFNDTLRAFYVDDSILSSPVFTTEDAFGPGNANIFSRLSWVSTVGAITCWKDNGLTVPANVHTIPADGSGTLADPFTNAQYCDMPTGSRLDSLPFSFYEVRAQDYALSGHILGDVATYKALDLCESGINCPTQALQVKPGSQTTVILRTAQLDTFIHVGSDHTDGSPNAPGNPQTAPTGSSVHDHVVVSSADNGPTPGGHVSIDWFNNTTCDGNPAASSGSLALVNGEIDATGFAQTLTATGGSFRAHYTDDSQFPVYNNIANGACEPVLPASLTIVKRTNGTDNQCPTVAVGSTVTWSYTVMNTGLVPLTNIAVTDDNGTPANTADDFTVGTIALLAPGASATLTHTGPAIAGSYINVAKAQSAVTTATTTFTVSATEPDCYFGSSPGINIVKKTNGTDNDSPTGPIVAVGSTVTWTYFVTNTGNVPLASVTVTDNNGTPGNTADDFHPTFTGGDTNSNGLLDLTETWTYTASAIATAGQYENFATVTGTGGGQTVTDDNPDHYFGAAPALTIVKRTNGTNNTCPTVAVGSTVTWTYLVTNTGNVTLTNIVVTDNNGTPANTADDFHPAGSPIASLAPGASTTLTATGTATAGSYANIATASTSFTASGITIPVSGTEPDCYFGASPGINIVKKTNGTDNDSPTGPSVPVGSTVTWTYFVTNTGNVPLSNVVVTDDNGTPGNLADDFHPTFTGGDTNSNGLLDLTETWTYQATGIATAGQYENFGTVTGTGGGQTVTDNNPDHYFGQVPTVGTFTPGYWKNHQAHTTSLLPISLGNFVVGTFSTATDVFDGMNCGASKPQSAIGCLAGHLLAAKLNVANGASTCIAPKIALADTFLSGGVVMGVTGVNYIGPSGTYNLTAMQRNVAINLKDFLDKYNNGGGC